MTHEKIFVSAFFLNLLDLYLGDLEQIQGNGSIDDLKSILEKRREDPANHLILIRDNPEYAAPLFYGMFVFWTGPENKVLEKLVGCETYQSIPSFSRDISNEVTFRPYLHSLLSHVQNHPSHDKFLSIVVSLEYLRYIDWSPKQMENTPDASTENEDSEDNWGENEAPNVIGLDSLATN